MSATWMRAHEFGHPLTWRVIGVSSESVTSARRRSSSAIAVAAVTFVSTMAFGQDKVVFGTDFPVLQFERTRQEIEDLGLRAEPKRKLLRDNARRLYKLGG